MSKAGPLREGDRRRLMAQERLRPVRRRAARRCIRRALFLCGAVLGVVWAVLVVGWYIEFEHAMEYPEEGNPGWQCAADSGPCEHRLP